MKDKVSAPLIALAEVRGRLFPLLPVLMGIGIGWWFSLKDEPGALSYLAAALLGGMFLGIALRGHYLLRVPAWGAVALVAGFLLIGARAWIQEAPVLGFRYYGAIEGRVVEVDRSAGDHLRLTLDRVVLERTAPERTPEKVRVSLHGDQSFFTPQAGARVILTGHLMPPMPPSQPGGFDFRRVAWFQQLGALGYTQSPVLLLAPPEPATQLVNRLRERLSAAVRSHIDGQAGAFASGSVTGDRSGITQDTVVALRDSNLSHLLAISGMNLAFLVSFVFAVLRFGLALVPAVALRVNTKKIAAAVAVGVAGFYLALSGGNIATERAFIMSAIMLGAVLADRRALSMRTAALSGIILLALQPEALINAGFQMSMAATVGLIWGFGAVDRLAFRQRLPRWSVPVYVALLSSVIGGLATGPIAAAQFNRFADFGLLANLLTVPAMGMLIMPGAVIATLLAPFGLPQPGMWMMEAGARWILAVAHWVAGWEGAVTGIPAPPPWVLPALVLGTVWIIVWPQRVRLLGVLPMAVALAGWSIAERPAVLVAADGILVGIMGNDGRSLSYPSGGSFVANSWLQSDGDLVAQDVAAARGGFREVDGIRSGDLDGLVLAHLKGKAAPNHLARACELADVVVIAARLADPHPEDCRVIDQQELSRTGAMALSVGEGGLVIRPTLSTRRVWDGKGQ